MCVGGQDRLECESLSEILLVCTPQRTITKRNKRNKLQHSIQYKFLSEFENVRER